MRNHQLFWPIVLWALLPTIVCAQGGALPTRVDSFLQALHQRERFNGAVAVLVKGQVIYQRGWGWGDAAAQQPLTAQSAFNLASISKQFIGFMVMQLAREGRLRYDDPVVRYLPTLPYPNLTIRHLLTHTGGLPEYFDLAQRGLGPLDTLTNAGMLALFADLKPQTNFAPGEKWEYSNTGYVLLGSVIAAASGQSVATYFAEKIARPLGLKHTYFFHHGMVPAAAAPNRVYGWNWQQGRRVAADLTRLDGVVGDGNAYASVEDLARWVQALERHTLLPEEWQREAYTPVRLNDGTTYPYGFGWGIAEAGQVLRHTGSWVGFLNLLHRDRGRDYTLILLSNAGQNLRPVEEGLIAIMAGKKPRFPEQTLLYNVRLADGTGAPLQSGALRIVDQRIDAMGPLRPLPGETVIDGGGQVLAPGFIDTHSHHDWGALENPTVPMALAQGITTIIVGQDGSSRTMAFWQEQWQKTPLALNLATFVGHNTVRIAAMGSAGFRRQSTAAELTAMKTLLQQELDAGALGLSTGLEYEQGFYSNRNEVLELAQTTAAAGGRYTSHIRSEDVELEAAVEEIIEIGRIARLPVNISHFKVAMRSKWGTSRELLAQLQEARRSGVNITADWYPYEYWSSTMRVLFPQRDYTNLASAEFALRELTSPDKVILSRYAAQPSYENQTLAQVAQLRRESPAQTLLHLVAESAEKATDEAIICGSMTESDLQAILSWNYTNICSDGAATGHPRGHGAYARVLARYVREQKLLTLEQAIYKMTGLAAENSGLAGRGLLRPGYFADLVLFDPAQVLDRATFEKPQQLAVGFAGVWVNGRQVFANGQATQSFPGRLLRRN